MASHFSVSSVTALGRRYGIVFSAGILSDIGGFTMQTALVLHLYKLTGHNKAFMGLAALAWLAPWLLGSPLGGVWAEKFNRRRIMMLFDAVRLPLVLLMPATTNVWFILALQAAISASTAIFNPSRQSIIPELVGKEQIHLANSINGGSLSIVHVLGPVFGALIYDATGTMFWVAMMNAATYVVSFLLLAALKYEANPDPHAARFGMLENIYQSLAYVAKEKDLFTILTALLTSNAAVGLAIPLFRPFIDEVLHGGDRTYGYLIGAFGLGGCVGPLLGYIAGKKLGLGRTIFMAFAIEAFLFIIWSRIESIPWSLAVLFIWGVNIFMMIPCYLSYVHTYAKPEFMGRTFALFDQSIFFPQIFGAVLVMAFGNRLPTQNLFTFSGIAYVLIVVVIARTSGAKLLRSRRGGEKADPHAPAHPEPQKEPALN